MYVREMYGPEDNDDEPTRDVTWEQIDEAIRRLDGRRSTLVTIGPGGEAPHMGIGGGHIRYIAYVTFDNLRFHNLVDPGQPSTQVALVAGGQKGDYPARQCVDLEHVLRVAKEFALHGRLDRSVSWEEV